jgi:hypothetical protein
MLEGGTQDEIRISKEALFKGVSTRFGLRTIGKVDPTFQNTFPGKHFSTGVSTRFGLQNRFKGLPGKRILKRWFGPPKSSFGEHKFARINLSACVFVALSRV